MATEISKLHSLEQSVPLAKMRVSDRAQRLLNPARVSKIAEEFDPEMFGLPVVNLREGHYYIIDGQHRVAAAKVFLGNWETQSVTCRCYKGLSEQQEAEMFDRLNYQLGVTALDKYFVRLTAGRKTETAVAKVVEKSGLVVARNKAENVLTAVACLVSVYERDGGQVLEHTLITVSEAFGGPGLVAPIIDGVARVFSRYPAVSIKDATESLRVLRGGPGHLLTKAGLLKKQTGKALGHCVAAATVDVLNSRRSKKLPSWWKEG